MAVVIKNTFLDVAEHKFLYFDEPCGATKRSHSMPREWKPIATDTAAICPSDGPSTPRSELSFHSALESLQSDDARRNTFEKCSSGDGKDSEADVSTPSSIEFCCATPTSSLGSPREFMEFHFAQSFSCCSDGEAEAIVETPSSISFCCATPTSSLGSPRELMGCSPEEVSQHFGSCRMNFGFGKELDKGSSYMVSSKHSEPDVLRDSTAVSAGQTDEPEVEPETEMDAKLTRTNVKSRLHVSEPVTTSTDTRVDAVISCLRLTLSLCGQACDIKIEKGLAGVSSMLISAQLQSGPNAPSRCYKVMQAARQALDSITTQLPTATLLSARMQKEDWGYSLRSNIACLPDHARDYMCWDMFKKGSCPRRDQCRWYHPQDSDIARVKVTVRYSEDVSAVSKEACSAVVRHKLSLGELVSCCNVCVSCDDCP